MIFPEAALFEFGKSELKPEGKEKIEEYREQAKEELSRADHVMITGYTDNVGETDYNSTLSQQRAEAVRDHSDQSRGRSQEVSGQRCGRGQADRR